MLDSYQSISILTGTLGSSAKMREEQIVVVVVNEQTTILTFEKKAKWANKHITVISIIVIVIDVQFKLQTSAYYHQVLELSKGSH